MNWNDLFEYRNGELWPKPNPRQSAGWNARHCSRRAGTLRSDGYRRARAHGKRAYEHVVIYEMFFGPVPEGFDVDHVNQIRDDNRIENLRLAKRAENKINGPVYRTSSSGFRGVQLQKRSGKYQASITVFGVRQYIGQFDTANEASMAYVAAATKAYGKFVPGDLS